MEKFGRDAARALLSQQVREARYFFLPAPARRPPVALVLGGREQCNPDYAIRRREFPFFVLEFVVAGRGVVRLGGREHTLRPGTVFSYSPTTSCEMQTDPRETLLKYFLCFVGGGVAARFRKSGVALGTSALLPAPAEITSLCEDLVREGQGGGTLSTRICAALAEVLLLKLEEQTHLAPRHNDPAREAFLKCKALIDTEAERLGSLDEIARAAGVEASSVCRWFRRYQGSSPYQYLLRRKMNLAAALLVENGGLVKEVAERVGFADPYHFSRAFKSVHGVPPRALLQYRHR